MSKIDEKAIASVQDKYAKENGKYRDISIRMIIEAYEAAKASEQQDGKSSFEIDETSSGLERAIFDFLRGYELGIRVWEGNMGLLRNVVSAFNEQYPPKRELGMQHIRDIVGGAYMEGFSDGLCNVGSEFCDYKEEAEQDWKRSSA
ncbi:MAG: hypothetical protein KGL39_39925, partial [Patescibacteria group bacterium]|nr:hypothetical protein [Patescibacteria group bacterium]